MAQRRSYTYELKEGLDLLFTVKKLLQDGGAGWREIGDMMPSGHVEYRPLRTNPLRSGYRYVYTQAGLNVTLYFPEATFNSLAEKLNRERLLQLKSVFQKALPQRSGYIIQEFKIRGILDDPHLETGPLPGDG
ncbi:MAG: hypothetical protein ACE5ER_01225 [Nitrospinaceae bacterium]